MTVPIPLDELRIGPTAFRFEGDRHAPEGAGPVDLSFFMVRTAPGGGPGLHVHPYAEVFILQSGQAEYVVGDERLDVTAGHVVVVPPNTPHRYRNTGDEPLLQVSVHDAGRMVQHELERDG